MSTEVATIDQTRIDLIKQTVAKGATDLEFELFMHACKHTGLDPLMKQIYAIKRWSQADQREVLSFQTGIDGYRLIADRTGKYAGSSDAIFEEKDGKPLLAQVTVLKVIDGEKCAFTASARWDEYVQRNRQMEPTSMWKKMPFLMLAKCAEAQALRKAFPMELSGLYTHEEMVHLDSEWKPTVRQGAEMLEDLEKREPPTELETQLRDSLKAQEEKHDNPRGGSTPPESADVPSNVAGGSNESMEQVVERDRVTLRTCERTSQAITHAYNAIPEERRQDSHSEFQTQLRSLNKGKKP